MILLKNIYNYYYLVCPLAWQCREHLGTVVPVVEFLMVCSSLLVSYYHYIVL